MEDSKKELIEAQNKAIEDSNFEEAENIDTKLIELRDTSKGLFTFLFQMFIPKFPISEIQFSTPHQQLFAACNLHFRNWRARNGWSRRA